MGVNREDINISHSTTSSPGDEDKHAHLLSRIENRGIYHERLIEAAYLQRLSDSYVDFFYHYSDTPLLIVNAAEVDFVNNDNDYEQLLQRLRSIKTGRHFYNPNPELI